MRLRLRFKFLCLSWLLFTTTGVALWYKGLFDWHNWGVCPIPLPWTEPPTGNPIEVFAPYGCIVVLDAAFLLGLALSIVSSLQIIFHRGMFRWEISGLLMVTGLVLPMLFFLQTELLFSSALLASFCMIFAALVDHAAQGAELQVKRREKKPEASA